MVHILALRVEGLGLKVRGFRASGFLFYPRGRFLLGPGHCKGFCKDSYKGALHGLALRLRYLKSLKRPQKAYMLLKEG